MTGEAAPSGSNAKIVLALSSVIIALSFAFPLTLVPSSKYGAISNEAMNLYACTAWAGWAHFVFAYVGQLRSIVPMPGIYQAKKLGLFVGSLVVSLVFLFALWLWVGPEAFGALVWVYFIDHFLKAEQFFALGKVEKEPLIARWIRSYQPILCFGWLSVVLLDFGDISGFRWIIWGVSAAMAAMVLLLGGWQDLRAGDKRGTLISLFFVAEAAVWGTLSGFTVPEFLVGVYIFHVALGSFYHYLGAYFAAVARRKPGDGWLRPVTIVLVNLGIAALGYFTVNHSELVGLKYLLDPDLFTLWVGLHLVASDVFPLVRNAKV